jgi:hypothetical protein
MLQQDAALHAGEVRFPFLRLRSSRVQAFPREKMSVAALGCPSVQSEKRTERDMDGVAMRIQPRMAAHPGFLIEKGVTKRQR